jgi:hypothetical protein
MRGLGIQRPLEVETRTLDELREVLAILDAAGNCGGASDGGSSGGSSGGSMITRVMLDNMTRKSSGAPGWLRYLSSFSFLLFFPLFLSSLWCVFSPPL